MWNSSGHRFNVVALSNWRFYSFSTCSGSVIALFLPPYPNQDFLCWSGGIEDTLWAPWFTYGQTQFVTFSILNSAPPKKRRIPPPLTSPKTLHYFHHFFIYLTFCRIKLDLNFASRYESTNKKNIKESFAFFLHRKIKTKFPLIFTGIKLSQKQKKNSLFFQKRRIF